MEYRRRGYDCEQCGDREKVGDRAKVIFLNNIFRQKYTINQQYMVYYVYSYLKAIGWLKIKRDCIRGIWFEICIFEESV